jgi:hypothetical protein
MCPVPNVVGKGKKAGFKDSRVRGAKYIECCCLFQSKGRIDAEIRLLIQLSGFKDSRGRVKDNSSPTDEPESEIGGYYPAHFIKGIVAFFLP